MKCIATVPVDSGVAPSFFRRTILCKRELRIGISCSSTTRNKRMSMQCKQAKDNIARRVLLVVDRQEWRCVRDDSAVTRVGFFCLSCV